MFFGALDEMATNWILSDRKYELVADADAVVDVFLHGLAGPPPGTPAPIPSRGHSS